MILTGKEIVRQVKMGKIIIDPFDEKNVNPNSYNYRLGSFYRIAKSNIFDTDDSIFLIPESGLLLRPGSIILSNTYEIIGSENFVTSLIGRSSIGRLGLFVQISADLGHLGSSHKWTLELTCVQPILIYPKMKIGQISFWVSTGEYDKYHGSYTNYNIPQICMDSQLLRGHGGTW